jgi:hypothetical protein
MSDNNHPERSRMSIDAFITSIVDYLQFLAVAIPEAIAAFLAVLGLV